MQSTTESVRKSVTVRASLDRAFEVFTAHVGTWWNPSHSIGAEPFETAVIEPRQGGRWYERGTGGAECPWGEVLVWEPPARVVLAWRVSATWQFDPDLHTEVDVRFVAVDPSTTRVELEHRGLEAYGERSADMRAAFESPQGWSGLLDRFAQAVP